MKQNISLLAFFIVWAITAVMYYLLNLLLGKNGFTNDWQEFVIIGFAGAMGGFFGPKLAAWIGKFFKKSRNYQLKR